MAMDFHMQFDTCKEAIVRFINYLIETYGNRYSITVLTVDNFLNNIHFDAGSHSSTIEFANDLRILRDTLNFIGTSSSINNFYFLKTLLSKLPQSVKSAWDKYEFSTDPLIRDISVSTRR